MKKIIIVVGTRPNFIKITQFEKEFAKFGNFFDYTLVHTGQHYDTNMSDVFFSQLQLKQPHFLNIKSTDAAAQIGEIILKLSDLFKEQNPDGVMVVGDVNSTLAGAIAAHKCGIRLFHLESGLRSFDRSMPEEINRILTDEITDDFFVTEQSGITNLVQEGKDKKAIHFVGNTMIDTLVAFDSEIKKSTVLDSLKIQEKQFALVTIHRPANVDVKENLEVVVDILQFISQYVKIVFPIHPRTVKNLEKYLLWDRFKKNDQIITTDALNYLDFQKLVSSSAFVLTDSGGVQEETTFRKIPCLTLRDNTERPSTITVGSNELVELNLSVVSKKIEAILNGQSKSSAIPDLWDGKATERVVQILKQKLETNE